MDMLHKKMLATLLSARIIPQAETSLRAALQLRPDEYSIGILTTDSDDVSYAALDAATKMAAVRVAYARSMYAGAKNASNANTGEFIGILAGPDPAAVRSGMDAAIEYMNEDCCFISANEQGTVCYFAHCIARTGSYLSSAAGIDEGEPLAYLIAPPMEAIWGMDAALKVAAVRLALFYGPPTETNFAGGLLTGTQASCRAACEAFAAAVEEAAMMPKEMLTAEEA
jgi:ethanolamine utilization protein EutL